MNLGIGLKLTQPRGGPAPWTPASLPDHVETWLGSMLGADASAIASWPGLTGTHTLAQGSAGNRPTVGVAAGKKYAILDGTDDWIEKSPYTQGGAAGHSVFAAIRMTASGSYPMLFTVAGAGIRELRCSADTRVLQFITNTSGSSVPIPAGLSVDTDYVVGVSVDFATDAVSLYVDGVEVATGTDSTDPVASPATALSIGARVGNTIFVTNVWPGRVYALAYCESPLTAGEVALLTAYLQEQMP